jgi:hemoglobin-like flavoprotein
MTPKQTELVRETWERLSADGSAVTELFYERLFQIDPSTRELFANADMAAQRSKLLQALGIIVADLERPDALAPVLQSMGRRHLAYGVRKRHYSSVGDALLWSFERGLGDDWTREAEAAWERAYALVSGMMSAAAEGAG